MVSLSDLGDWKKCTVCREHYNYGDGHVCKVEAYYNKHGLVKCENCDDWYNKDKNDCLCSSRSNETLELKVPFLAMDKEDLIINELKEIKGLLKELIVILS